jgi:hypothetical protein
VLRTLPQYYSLCFFRTALVYICPLTLTRSLSWCTSALSPSLAGVHLPSHPHSIVVMVYICPLTLTGVHLPSHPHSIVVMVYICPLTLTRSLSWCTYICPLTLTRSLYICPLTLTRSLSYWCTSALSPSLDRCHIGVHLPSHPHSMVYICPLTLTRSLSRRWCTSALSPSLDRCWCTSALSPSLDRCHSAGVHLPSHPHSIVVIFRTALVYICPLTLTRSLSYFSSLAVTRCLSRYGSFDKVRREFLTLTLTRLLSYFSSLAVTRCLSRYGSFDKVREFLRFQTKIKNSLQNAVVRCESEHLLMLKDCGCVTRLLVLFLSLLVRKEGA